MSSFIETPLRFPQDFFAGPLASLIEFPLSQWVVELLVSSSALILFAWLLTLTIRSWSGAVRHRVWFLTFGSLLVLPIGLLFFPSWQLPILPAANPTKLAQPTFDEQFDDPALNPSTEAASAISTATNRGTARQIEKSTSLIENQASVERTTIDAYQPATRNSSLPPIVTVSSWTATFWIIGIWFTGTLICAFKLFMAFVMNRRLSIGARPIEEASWNVLLTEYLELLAIKKPVTLLEAKFAIVPMTWGVMRPIIALPRTCNSWSESRCRAVLMHELAHIKRNDILTQTLSYVVCGLYWFHPLAWCGLRQLRIERELACDDCVISAGQKPSDYAQQLVQIARNFKFHNNTLGVAMASTSNLEHRVNSLLDIARSHVPLSRKLSRILLFGALVAIVGLSSVRIGHRALANTDPGEVANSGLTAEIPADAITGTGIVPGMMTSSSNRKVAQQTQDEKTKVISGKVVDVDGNLVSGAHVAIVATDRKRRNSSVAIDETVSTEDGNFELKIETATSKSHMHAKLVARKDGLAIGWRNVDLDVSEKDVTLKLRPEQVIRGRLVDLEGQPAAGLTLEVRALFVANAKPRNVGVGFYSPEIADAWIQPFQSNTDGKFEVHGVPAGVGAYLKLLGNDRLAPQDIALNTGLSETRDKRDATYRPLVKNVKPDEEAVLALSPAKFFTGTIRFEDTQEVVPNAVVKIWASQEEEPGSMVTTTTTADKSGKYRLAPEPGVCFGVSAFPPKGTPYLIRDLPQIVWKDGKALRTQDVSLPRGVLMKGIVREKETGNPIKGASVQYVPESANNEYVRDDILTGWQSVQRTDATGRFSIAILPGPGHLLVHAGDNSNYVLRTITGTELYKGKVGGRRNYLHAFIKVNPAPKSETIDLDPIELEPGGVISATVVDSTGTAVKNFKVFSTLDSDPTDLHWRGFVEEQTGGTFELSGMDSTSSYPIHVWDEQRRLGATINAKAGDSPKVVLKPCGEARFMFVDKKDGKPIAGYEPSLSFVMTPGEPPGPPFDEIVADSTFISNVDGFNHDGFPETNAKGEILFPALIPGAAYRITEVVDGRFKTIKNFVANSGKTLDLGELKVTPYED